MCDPVNLNGTNFSSGCQYILNSGNCNLDSGFINYYQWQYCAFPGHAAPTFFMIMTLLILLMGIAVTADSFFAPCLVVVTRILRMSQNLAGVTLLALGNGAADVFSSLSAVVSSEKPNVGLSFGSIIGAGILVNTITAGVIMIIKPFKVTRRPILKDLAFYLVALLICMVVLIRRQLGIVVSAILLTLYVLYVFVTGVGRALYVKNNRKKLEELSDCNVMDDNGVNLKSKKGNNSEDDEEDDPEATVDLPMSQVFSSFRHIEGGDGPKRPVTYMNAAYSADNGRVTISPESKQHQLTSRRFIDLDSAITAEEGVTSQDRPANSMSISVSNKPENKNIKSLRQKESVSINRASSTSHRRTGFLAQIIMANEYQRVLHKANQQIEIKNVNRPRTQSANVLDEAHTGKRARFYSSVVTTRVRSASRIPDRISTEAAEPESVVTMTCVPTVPIDPENQKPDLTRASTDSDINLRNLMKPEDRITTQYYLEFPGTVWHFLLTVLPVDLERWRSNDMGMLERVMTVAQAPIMSLLTLTVPVVDDSCLLRGWCRLLNSLHCLVSPLIWLVLFKVYMIRIHRGPFTLIYLEFIIGFTLCLAVFLTSKSDRPPIYHPLFAFLGFLTSIVWIYAIANEIVNILTVFGTVFSIPDTVLGLSVLALANSVGDLVSNIMLARRNFPRIAYAACIGGPLFNLLIGIGLPFAIKTAYVGSIEVEIEGDTIVLLFTAMLVTTMNMVALPLMQFRLRAGYGIVLIVIYVIFIVLVLLFATKVIKVLIP